MFKWGIRLGGAAILLAGTAFGVLHIPAVQDKIFVAVVKSRVPATDSPYFADDGLRLVICGSSSPLPDPHRARSCNAIIAGGKIYVVDAGGESASRLNSFGIPLDRLAAVFLTHFHSDHIADLAEMNFNSWGAGRNVPLPVYGGPGVTDVVGGFNQAYGADHQYRTAHHTEAVMPHEAGDMVAHEIDLLGPPDDAMDRHAEPLHFGDLTVTAIEVNHRPVSPAYGYRFDYKGRSITISGDTVYHPPLAVAAKGTDVLVHEAQSQFMVRTMQAVMTDAGRWRLAHIMHDIQSYHTDVVDAAKIGNQAGAKLLIFTHFTPPLINRLANSIFFRGVDAVRPSGWVAAHDGMMVTLPLGSDAVQVGEVK